MSSDSANPTDPHAIPPLLERRLNAAGVDMLIVTTCSIVLVWRFGFGEIVQPPPAWAGVVAAIVLAGTAMIEWLSGRTFGKSFSRLRVAGGGIHWLILRGVIKWLPVIITIGSLRIASAGVKLIILAIAGTVAVCYVAACYIALFRTGRTTFDLIAGTSVVAKCKEALE